MAKKESKSSLARILVPLIVGLVGAMVVLSQMNPSDKKADGETDPTPPPAEQAGDETPTEGPAPAATAEGEDEPEQPETDPEPGDATAEGETPEPEPADEPEVAVGKLDNPRAAFADKAASLDEPDDLLTLGSFDPEAGYEIAARINPYRASIYDLSVVNKYHKVNREEQYKLLNPISFDLGEANYPEAGSYAASYLIVNGQRVKLWKQDLQTSQSFRPAGVLEQQELQISWSCRAARTTEQRELQSHGSHRAAGAAEQQALQRSRSCRAAEARKQQKLES